ncbi:hypothetical protein E3T35_06240 [Cryobacterium sp. TMT1-2-2]|uniref:hypothetical protein n=1 Tax=Cryobacterium sp. TMT1-2-2 TaxID=1259233 RepID=UPI00106A776E|nr:hypothetical protein [Cryobacterium sp. TMT1-2-2]TFD12883.1 hypothetical protein E3T35_06240 [Cryobacterium sp. TMT1-2-2]
MGVAMGLWRVDGNNLTRVTPASVSREWQLDSAIESDPSILGDILLIKRQAKTSFGGRIDFLAMDGTATAIVVEDKRGMAHRDVIGQILGYATWAAQLSRAELSSIFAADHPDTTLAEAFYNKFHRLLPAEVGATPILTIVAASIDAETESILQLLRDHNLPINVFLFRRFDDLGTSYLGTWLVENDAQTTEIDSTARLTTRQGPSSSDKSASLKEITAMSAARDRIDQQIRSHVNELRADPHSARSWANIADAIGVPSAAVARQLYGSDLTRADDQVLSYWKAFVARFTWDFLPAGFLYALYEYWMSKEFPEDTPVLKEPFTRLLYAAATASGGWIHRRSRPGSLMDAVEPLTELVPHWTRNRSNAAMHGLRRLKSVRSSVDAAEASHR